MVNFGSKVNSYLGKGYFCYNKYMDRASEREPLLPFDQPSDSVDANTEAIEQSDEPDKLDKSGEPSSVGTVFTNLAERDCQYCNGSGSQYCKCGKKK